MAPEDRIYMERALALAAQGRGRVSPNPMVGAILVKEGSVVGEGFHPYAGGDHAEVVAVKAAGRAAQGAVLFVTLEPCCHYGKTPPCTEALIKAGIVRVVVATLDPNPAVAGKGVRRLREAGIAVEMGPLGEEAVRLNEAYFKYIQTRRPFVILKAALSLDGKLATRTGDSRWITGEMARRRVHQLRNEVDAVLTGIGTVLKDDPQLTTRLETPGGRDPLRVIVDSRARLPSSAQLLQTGTRPPLIAVGPDAPRNRTARLREAGAELLVIPKGEGGLSLPDLMAALGRRGVTSVMIEGGGRLSTSALQAGIVDKVLLMIAPILIGGRTAPTLLQGEGVEKLSEAGRLKEVTAESLGEDLVVEGYLADPPQPLLG